jgi:glycosyltransferase involved in cell wall biosynthesis
MYSNIIRDIEARDDRFRVVKHSADKGLGGARNTGLNDARGEYIYFLDSADYISPKTLDVMFKTIGGYQSDFFIGRVLHSYPDEDGFTEGNYLEACQSSNVFATSLDKTPEFVIHVAAWHKLINRAFLEEYGILFKLDLKLICGHMNQGRPVSYRSQKQRK